MSRKAKPASTKPSPRKTRPAPFSPPQLDPKEQRAALENLLAEQGVKPVEDFDKFLEEVGGVWPEDEDIDEFLTWLRKLRRGELV